MKVIRHRVNTLSALAHLPAGLGAEIDLRSWRDRIVLEHEPFRTGADLDAYLDRWADGTPRATLVLNPKEDGLEGAVMDGLARRGITDWFLLDLPLPTIVRLTVREGVRGVAIRCSEYEPIEATRPFAGRADWVWLDSFDGAPPAPSLVERLRERFRVCLVSPELQGHPAARIDAFRPLAATIDAVCTKHPERWGAA